MAERNSVREKRVQNKILSVPQDKPRKTVGSKKSSNLDVNNVSSKHSTYSGSATGRDYADQMVTQLEQQNEQLR